MARVKRGVTSHAKHKKTFKAAKGYYGRRKNTIRIAKQAVEKANQYAYRDRKNRNRSFRALCIQRINAATRAEGMTYGRFIDGLGKAGVEVDRKVLADIAVRETATFKALVKKGSISELLKTLGTMMPEERKQQGPLINGLRDRVSEAIAQKREALKRAAIAGRLAADKVDV